MNIIKKIILCVFIGAPLYGMLPEIPENPSDWTIQQFVYDFERRELLYFITQLHMAEVNDPFQGSKNQKNPREQLISMIKKALQIKNELGID